MGQVPDVVLFDLDGTLIDSSHIVVDIYYESLVELGYPTKQKNFIATLAGKSSHDTGRALGVSDLDLDKLDGLFWEKFGQYTSNVAEISVFNNAREVLELLDQHGVLIGVVTSNEAKNARLLLEKADLARYIQVFVGKENTIERKPDPSPIYYALDKLNVTNPDRKVIWFIGDSASDVGAASNAGILSIAIPQPSTLESVINAKPDMLIDTMADLLHLIENQFFK